MKTLLRLRATLKTFQEGFITFARLTWKEATHPFKLVYRFAQNIWDFRKELWNFRRWDHSFNMNMLLRSLELSRDFYRSGKAVSQGSEETAEEIDLCVRLLRDAMDPMEAASRDTGIPSLELMDSLGEEWMIGNYYKWKDNPPETWTTVQRRAHELDELEQRIETERWEQGMTMLKDRMQCWWD